MPRKRPPDGKHYHVLVGLQGGYMPASNDPCRLLKEAEGLARDLAAVSRDDGMKVVGSARARLYLVGEHSMIEITTCYETECWEDIEAEDDWMLG